MKNVVLIGMPGSGKSTLGVVLAKVMCYSFVDTDLIITKKAGMPLQKILDKNGLDRFLELEQEAGESLECESTVIATGGSMVLSEKAMKHLAENSVIVFIDVPLKEIKRRITNLSTRGIAFHSGDTLDDVFDERVPLYEKYADVKVVFENATDIENTVDKIYEKIKYLL